MKSSIANLLLLPKCYSIEDRMHLVEKLLKNNTVFSRFYQIEKSIQSTLTAIEGNGLMISNEWFRGGLEEKRNQLAKVKGEINHYIGVTGDEVNATCLNQFWTSNSIPAANSFDALRKYKHLHPTYKLMLEYKNHQNYLKMWDERLRERGMTVDDGILLKGKFRSFSSYTGRITARDLPLTAIPVALHDYVIPPKGYQIVSLDLDNAELRFLAHYAKCDSLVQQFNKGIDVHAETAKLIRDSFDGHDINQEQSRKIAKIFTYSLLYGAGTQTIAKNMRKTFYNVTSADVATLTDAFYQRYPELQCFLYERGENEKLLTPFGEIKPVSKFTKAQRKNHGLQCSVAVAIKVLLTTLAEHDIKIIHVIHDEAWILVPEEESVEDFTEKPIEEFTEKINEIFPGLPMTQILTKENIGGK